MILQSGNQEIIDYMIDNGSNKLFANFDKNEPLEFLNERLTILREVQSKRNLVKAIETLESRKKNLKVAKGTSL